MFLLVTGGSASGKSEYAEARAVAAACKAENTELCRDGRKKYYIAARPGIEAYYRQKEEEEAQEEQA